MAASLQLYAFAITPAFMSLVLITLYWRYDQLSHIPGPLLASLTDHWRAYHQNAGKFTAFSLDLHKRYGPIVRVGPNTVHVTDATVIPAIYTNHGEFRKVSDRQQILKSKYLTMHRQTRMDP